MPGFEFNSNTNSKLETRNSEPGRWWSELESNQPLGFFKPTLIRLSYPTETLPIADFRLPIAQTLRLKPNRQLAFGNRQLIETPSFAMHPFHNVTIVVYIHEEVLAPLSARLRVVTKHNAFEFHA